MLLSALAAGLRLGFGRPALALLLWAANFAVALPAALVLASTLQASFEGRVAEERMRDGFDMGWFSEFAGGAAGLASSFRPGISGGGGLAANLDGWATGRLFELAPALIALGIGYAVVWLLLLGGVLSRFAEPERPFGPTLLLQKGAEHFFPLLRLALLSAPLYAAVYGLHGFLARRLAEALREVTAERTVLLATLGLAAVTVALLAWVQLVFGFAKVAIVLEGRGSLRAARRGLEFVLRHPWRACGLWSAIGALSTLVLAIWIFTAPGATQSTPAGIAAAFFVGQLVLLVRLMLRLTLVAAQLELYRAASRA